MELSKAGDWQFVDHMVLPDGRELDRQFEIKGDVQPYSRKGAVAQNATAFLGDFFAAWRLCER